MAVPVEAQASLTSVTAAGPGTVIDFTVAKVQVTSVIVVNGTVTDGLVAMEASHDGTNWVHYGSVRPRTGVNQSLVTNTGAFRYWRANVLTEIAGGGSVSATFMEAG